MDELYVIARRVLLDALEAMGEHREATILVGAQAIYLHTGAAELGVAEYTTDADLALDPALLAEIPPLEQALEGAGFYGSPSTIGIWKTSRRTSQAIDIDVQVDLLVPATVSPGAGRRAARLTGHGVHAARKVDGLEGVLVDQAEHDIASLEPDVDARVVRAKVAGPGPCWSPSSSRSTSAAPRPGRTTRMRSTCSASSRRSLPTTSRGACLPSSPTSGARRLAGERSNCSTTCSATGAAKDRSWPRGRLSP